MKAIKIIIFIIIAGVLLSGCQRYEKVENQEYRINYTGKTKVILENVSGKININRSDSSTGLFVKAEKIGMVKKKDLDKPLTVVGVDIDTLAGSTIRIESRISKTGGIFKFGMSNKVNYNIYLPEGLTMEVDNVNGDIEINDCNNNFSIDLTNGSITARNTGGNNKFDLVNGKFFTQLDSTKGLSVETVNGSITLELAPSFQGGFEAEWVNGRFNNEGFVFNVSDTDKKNFKGYIGSREPEIKLTTVNGKINLVKK